MRKYRIIETQDEFGNPRYQPQWRGSDDVSAGEAPVSAGPFFGGGQ